MGAAKKMAKGLAAGALLGAVAAMIVSAAKKDPGAKASTMAAKSVAKKVGAHAKKIGKITKGAYDAIVETTMAEARGAKQLSKGELDELRKELTKSWKELSAMFTSSGKK